MNERTSEDGFSLIELMVSTTIVLMVLGGITAMLIQNSQVYRAENMNAAVQATARTTMSMVTNAMFASGWDPRDAGFTPVVVDPAPTSTSNFIELRTDLDEDGTIDTDEGEDTTIRWNGSRVEWRRTSDTSVPFTTLAEDITNDEDGDGTTEPMFVADSLTDPTRITVKITARSAVPEPRTHQYLRFTITTDVVLR